MAKKVLNLDSLIGAIIVLIMMGVSYSGLPIFEKLEGYIYGMGVSFSQSGDPVREDIAIIDIDEKSSLPSRGGELFLWIPGAENDPERCHSPPYSTVRSSRHICASGELRTLFKMHSFAVNVDCVRYMPVSWNCHQVS